MAKTDYSVQLRGVEGVAAASPSAGMQAEQMRGQMVSQAIGSAANTIFGAYEGYKQQEVRDNPIISGEREAIKGELEQLKAADIANNAMLEQRGQEPTVLAAFRKEQERIGQAISQMPGRLSEWRMRASKELRTAINANPGLANSLRQVAMETTGIKDLDMYSVTNLYDEIDLVAKRQQQAQQAQAKAYEEGLKRFVKDTANAMSETQAAAAYASMTDDQRVQIAQDAFRTEQRKKAFDDSLKMGGMAIENGVTNLIAALDTGNVTMMNTVRQKMKDAGIDEVALTTGTLSEEQRANPKLPALLAEAAAIHRSYIDKGYQEGLAKIQAAISNGAVDSQAGRNARSDLEKWYTASIEKLNKDGVMTLLGAMTTADEKDPQKILDTRLRTINYLKDSFGIPPEIATQFAAGDEKRKQAIRTQYPQWGIAFDHVKELQNAALRGVSNKDWIEMIKKGADIKAAPTINVPTSRVEVTASVVAIEDSLKRVRDGAVANTADAPATVKSLSGGFALRDAGEKILREYSKAVTKQMSLIPQGERAAVMQQVASSFDASVYGATGHGDEVYNRVKALEGQFALVNSKPVFQDSSGTTPLAIRLVGKGTPLREDYSKVALAEPSDKKVNAALASVDTAIRLRSLATGEDVRVLRKQFIDTFNKGKPSEVFTSLPATAAPSAEQQPQGGTKQVPSSPAPVGTLKKESQLKGAVESGIEDLKRELQQYQADLADAKPGSPLHTRITEDIKGIQSELKRLGAK
jgi:hypothetical protein